MTGQLARVMAIVALVACAGQPGRAAGSGRPVSLALPSLDGGTVLIAGYRGRPVVLHFFTVWDSGAQLDVDQLQRLHAERGDEIAVVGIALDVDRDLVGPWRRAVAASYPVAMATESVRSGSSALGRLDVVPTTVVLDRNGAEITRVERPLRPGELDRLVRLARPR